MKRLLSWFALRAPLKSFKWWWIISTQSPGNFTVLGEFFHLNILPRGPFVHTGSESPENVCSHDERRDFSCWRGPLGAHRKWIFFLPRFVRPARVILYAHCLRWSASTFPKKTLPEQFRALGSCSTRKPQESLVSQIYSVTSRSGIRSLELEQ